MVISLNVVCYSEHYLEITSQDMDNEVGPVCL